MLILTRLLKLRQLCALLRQFALGCALIEWVKVVLVAVLRVAVFHRVLVLLGIEDRVTV